ncbi:MAG TPA: PAS domain-containing protein [Verrucomicrobiae bacterium]|nr:PAS domain-containing protein [Verrucomicrobiae bacterium]
MKKILVIDDDPAICRATMIALQKGGYEAIAAADGAEGLALTFAQHPNLVLADVNMTRTGGFTVLKELRAHPETAAIPVILMTGDLYNADARTSMEHGADDHLQKPFRMEKMLAAVRARLERCEAAEAQTKSERISAEQKLHLLNSALEAAVNGVVITQCDGKILWVNQAFTRLTGYEAAEVTGRTTAILKSGHQSREFYTDMWNTVLAGGAWHGELINRRKDGSHYYEEMTITPVRSAQGNIENFIAIKQDISDRKKFEHMLATERDLLQSLMDNLPDHIYFKDTESRFTRINHAHASYLGLDHPEKAIGKTDADYFPMRVARQKLVDERRLLITGEPILGLIEEINHAGKKSVISSTKVPIHDEAGNISGLVGISRDITAYRTAEVERQMMELQLRQAQKLESIGQLAAGIAHEINTPIQYVGDNTRFLKDAFGSITKILRSQEELLDAAENNALTPELLARNKTLTAESDLTYLRAQIPQAMADSLDGIDRVSKIVRAMKEFSHPGGREKCLANLNKAIESSVTVAGNEWKYVADMVTDLQPDLPFVPCFLGEFNQCILNLVVNAAHAIGDANRHKPGVKGCITIRTRRESDQVEVRISDTGTGIPEAHREKIFEPFFTTKGVGKGTGQGLSLVYGNIVKRHGGTVGFETETGRGTTFIIRLPLHATEAPTHASVAPKQKVPA